MNMWAGSWLMASVVIERMKQISSAASAICGNSSQISTPSGPIFLNFNCGPKQTRLLALELRQLLALGHALRHGLAVHLGQLGFPVEGFQVGRTAGHGEPDDALRLGRVVRAGGRRLATYPRAAAPCRGRWIEQRASAPRRPGPSRSWSGRSCASGQAASSRSILCMASTPRDGFVQVQDYPRDAGPGREFRRRNALRRRSESDLEQGLGRGRVLSVLGQVLVQHGAYGRQFVFTRLAPQGLSPSPGDRAGTSAPPSFRIRAASARAAST